MAQKLIQKIKSDFPIFDSYPDLVYLDNSSTSQKPLSVIQAVSDFYTFKNANIHRAVYHLAELATEIYENTRMQVGEFIHARGSNEIVFTGNTNEGINLVAYGWARKFLKKGDIIVLSEMEHHANIVPWLRLREEIGIEIVYLPINNDYRLDFKIEKKNFERIKFAALTHASNVLGTINPLHETISYFKKYTSAKILIDAAQSIPHLKLDVQKLNADFLVFSSHKMLGPSGVGVLWARENLLEDMEPLIVGSHMISSVSKEKATWADVPDKFEAGTRYLEGVAGLSAAISYLDEVGYDQILSYENELTAYALKKFKQLPYIVLYGPQDAKDRLGIFSFGIAKAHPHDIAQILDRQNIAIRSGHHCAQVTMDALGVPATARASFYLYNTREDIDRLIDGIKEVKKTLRI
jgi:cysteine desulfurase/selenocysteine lyase